MASFKRTNITDESLTILTASGVVTCEDVIHALEDFFEHNVAQHLLWNIMDADISGVTQDDMEQIIAVSKEKAHLRKNGRTALVVRQDLSFGLSRMYEILSELRGHPIPYRVFRDMDIAITWLKTGE
ncbi:MAG: hypothetical protein SV775_11455 [Thermodesulfobacteriota bacterium]|nr:hypothetical protein [Thermodesulfobacteriota bacterium]